PAGGRKTVWYYDRSTERLLEEMPTLDNPATRSVSFVTNHFSGWVIITGSHRPGWREGPGRRHGRPGLVRLARQEHAAVPGQRRTRGWSTVAPPPFTRRGRPVPRSPCGAAPGSGPAAGPRGSSRQGP